MRTTNQRGDMTRVTQAHIGPGLARLRGLVDPIAIRDIAADARFAAACVDYVGIRIGNGHRPDRGHALLFEQWIPRVAAARPFPNAASHRPEVTHVWLRGHTSHRNHTAS